QVELKSVYDVAPPECLLLVERGGREVRTIGRQLVRVAVEMEDGERTVAAGEKRIVETVGRERDRRPADLALLAREHARAERLRDQLRAEADAKHGAAGCDRLLDQRRLRPQEGILVLLVGAHRATQDDQPADAAYILRHGLAARDVERSVLNAALAKRIPEQT